MKVVKQFTNDSGHKFASIYTDLDQRLLMDVWNGAYGSEYNLTSVLGYTFAQLKTQDLRCWLCDVSQIEGDLTASAEATVTLFDMLLSSSSLDKFAFVSKRPAHPARDALTQVLEKYDVQVKVFATYPAAMEWLLVPSIEEDVWEDVPMMSF